MGFMLLAKRRCRIRPTRSIFLAVLLAAAVLTYNFGGASTETIRLDRRHLLSAEGAVWEQCGKEKASLPGVFLFIYAFLIFHLFLGVAILCDDFFVPSLEGISSALQLSEDVAGATFMAAGQALKHMNQTWNHILSFFGRIFCP